MKWFCRQHRPGLAERCLAFADRRQRWISALLKLAANASAALVGADFRLLFVGAGVGERAGSVLTVREHALRNLKVCIAGASERPR